MLEPIDPKHDPEEIRSIIRGIIKEALSNQQPQDPWLNLISHGSHKTISLLQKVEQNYPGYSTVIIPNEGFSDDDTTHNMVIDWLKQHDINVYSPSNEIHHLTKALRNQ
jgi:hypothetical protein